MKKSQLPAFNINKVEIGTRVVTRDRHLGRINSIDLEKLDYPVSAIIELDGKENTLTFTKEGRFYSDDKDSMFDLFLEEEEIEDQKSIQSEKQDKDEIDNYDPYKATVESIADMVDRYSELQSIEELKDFYNNVRVKCQDAFDYGKVCMINQDEEPDDKEDKDEVNRPQSKDNIPNGAIVFEDFNGGEGFYRIQIDYLSKKQVEELEQIVKDWNKEKKKLNQINKEIKTRQMTRQELADWLRDAPEEHREYRYAGDKDVYNTYDYPEDEANTPEGDVFIRRNHGEWEEPIIEE